ncbi:MAG: ABC transporter permease, partial [Bacteroidetes bacterium]|nr:ABC transporter permease [Bacteroidota bacterium]
SLHPPADRLYRVNYQLQFDTEINIARTPPTLGPAIQNYFPEVESMTRLYPRNVSVMVAEDDKQLELQNVFFADSTAPQVFEFDFIHGDANTALDNPFSVILTDETAEALFGTTDVVGRQIQLGGADNFQVTGVVKNWNDRAHLEFNMLVFFQNMVDLEPEHARETMRQVLVTNPIASHSYTYVLLKENQSAENVNQKFPAFVEEWAHERFKDKQSFSLFPVRDIHLHSTVGQEVVPSTNANLLTLFIGIGIITLVIACINFINLSTASSLNRSREVGIRKVLGAKQRALVGQFLGESMLLSFFAFILSLFLAWLGMPLINSITGLDLVFAPWQNLPLFLIFIAVFAFAGLLAGSYPAFFVSRFDPVASLKGSTAKVKNRGGVSIRKALITLQFLVAIVFISSAGVIFLQLNFFRNQPLGFDKELTLMVPIDSDNNINAVFRPGDAQMRQRMNTLDEELLSHANIKAVTQCSQQPGMGAIGRNVWTDKVPREENFFGNVLAVDYDYVETIGLEVIAGREFDTSFGTDHISSFVINETAVRSLQWASPDSAIGQKLTVEGKEGQVVGVIKDYHFASLYTNIDPLILEIRPGAFS